MSDSIDLFKPEGFIFNDLRPPNVTFKPRRASCNNKKVVRVYPNVNKRVPTESVDNMSAEKSMRLSNEFNPSHRLSMRLDDGKGLSRVSSRLNDGLPTDKQPFPNLKERLETQKTRDLNVDTRNPQFIKFLKYGIRRDHNRWYLPGNLGDIKICNKKLNCSLNNPANFNSTLVLNFPIDLNQQRLKDRLPKERKYVLYNHNLNDLIKSPIWSRNCFSRRPKPTVFLSQQLTRIISFFLQRFFVL